MRFRYTIIEEGNGSNEEKYLEVGKGTSKDIDTFLKELLSLRYKDLAQAQIHDIIF